MATRITPEEMEAYKRMARQRWQAEQEQLQSRRAKAEELARQAARLLKDQFGVSRVLVFGSLIHPGSFTAWSDIDLAAWGLTSKNWLRAMAAVQSLSREIEINLVDVDACSPALLKVIEKEGVEL
jgi:predicted nucleotidyltransferase